MTRVVFDTHIGGGNWLANVEWLTWNAHRSAGATSKDAAMALWNYLGRESQMILGPLVRFEEGDTEDSIAYAAEEYHLRQMPELSVN